MNKFQSISYECPSLKGQPLSPEIESEDSENGKSEELYEESRILYPYFFQDLERRSWIEMKRRVLLEQGEMKIRGRKNNVLMVVRRIKQMEKGSSVLESWVVSKKSMQVLGRYEGQPDCVDILGCEQQECRVRSRNTVEAKYQRLNMIFCGRCRLGNRSITIQDSKVSQKHLLLERVENPNTSSEKQEALNFICCCIRARRSKRTKISSLLAYLTAQLIKTITNFVGDSRAGADRYFISDNCSANGTLLRLPPVISAVEYLSKQVHLFIKKQRAQFRIISILRSEAQSPLEQRLNEVLSSKNQPTHNRNLYLENENIYKDISVLVLEVATSSGAKLQVLYSQEAPFKLIKPKFNIEILKVENWVASQDQSLCKIQYQSSWQISLSEGGKAYIPIRKKQKYEVKSAIFVRLSEATELQFKV